MSNSLTLELVSNGPIQYQSVSLAAHVKKPLEKFLFKKKLNEGAIPLEYFENKKINAKDGFRAIWCILKYNIWSKK